MYSDPTKIRAYADKNEIILDLTEEEFQKLRSIALSKGMDIIQFAECAIKTALSRRFRQHKDVDATIYQFLRAKDR